MRVKLANMPDPKKQGVITLQNLHGGLNLHEDPTHVAPNQSPDMLNMWYRDGMLKRRAGQTKVFDSVAGGSGTVWFYDKLFHGLVVYVAGTSICYFDPANLSGGIHTVSGTSIPSGEHGTFFAFDERLYYKAKGIYLRLSYENGALTSENILWQSGGGYAIANDVYTEFTGLTAGLINYGTYLFLGRIRRGDNYDENTGGSYSACSDVIARDMYSKSS